MTVYVTFDKLEKNRITKEDDHHVYLIWHVYWFDYINDYHDCIDYLFDLYWR